jgi:hypothetical protein
MIPQEAKAAAESLNAAETQISLDVAATISAIMWPLIVLIIVWVYRDKFLSFVASLSGRISKLSFAGVTVELTKAKEFTPNWALSGEVDIRKAASSANINDSTARSFMDQIRDTASADYGIIDLGKGKEWLTSRLYILSIILERMKGIKSFVFLETSGDQRQKFVGWAEPKMIRWAFARRFAWLEKAFRSAYGEIPDFEIVSSYGKLAEPNQPEDPQPAIYLLQKFLEKIQGFPPKPDDPEWQYIDTVSNTYEHAQWLTSEKIEDIMGKYLVTDYINLIQLQGKKKSEQINLVLAETGQYVAITKEDKRFDSIIERYEILESVSNTIVDQW